MKKFLQEFKTFAVRGNVVDLAVAVVIGTAFGKIVSSLVDTIIVPLTSIFVGGIDFSGLAMTFDGVSVRYGAFLQSIVDFLIVAFVIFLVIKAINRFKRTEEAESKVPTKAEEVKLLTEIRDTLRNRGA